MLFVQANKKFGGGFRFDVFYLNSNNAYLKLEGNSLLTNFRLLLIKE